MSEFFKTTVRLMTIVKIKQQVENSKRYNSCTVIVTYKQLKKINQQASAVSRREYFGKNQRFAGKKKNISSYFFELFLNSPFHGICEFAICGIIHSKYLTFLESSPRPLADLGLPSNLTRYDRISSSVADPEPDPGPEGSEAFGQIRIRSGTEINVSDLDSKPGPETLISNPVSDPKRLFRFRISSGSGQKFRILPVPDPQY
jgi:hypothetical protein